MIINNSIATTSNRAIYYTVRQGQQYTGCLKKLIFVLPRHAVQSAALPWQVVRPSVRSSVTLRHRGHIGWNSWKIISRLISLTFSLSADMTDLLQREHPQILAGIGIGYGKIGSGRTKLWKYYKVSTINQLAAVYIKCIKIFFG